MYCERLVLRSRCSNSMKNYSCSSLVLRNEFTTWIYERFDLLPFTNGTTFTYLYIYLFVIYGYFSVSLQHVDMIDCALRLCFLIKHRRGGVKLCGQRGLQAAR